MLWQDIVPGQISTARVNEELEEWRHTVQSDAQMKSKARTGSFPSAIVGKYSKRGSKSGSDDGVENTLITKFGASIREVSERQSSDCSASSRTSSAQSGMWAHIAAPSDGSGSSTPSSVATSAHGAPPSVVVPLDLASVNAQLNAAATQSSSSVSPIVSDTITRIPEDSVQHRPVVDKNLKYTGARVMTMLRVKQATPLDEKKETIRLLLLKHMQPSGGGSLETQSSIGANAAEGNSTLPLQQAVSGLTLSLPP